MEPQRLADGRIRIPVRATVGGIVGDGWLVIGPEHPEFAEWEKELPENRAAASSADSPR